MALKKTKWECENCGTAWGTEPAAEECEESHADLEIDCAEFEKLTWWPKTVTLMDKVSGEFRVYVTDEGV